MKLYTFYEDGGRVFVTGADHHFVEAEELYNMVEKIHQYADDNYANIPIWNANLDREWAKEQEREMQKAKLPLPKRPKHVYLMKCQKYYKIGVAGSIERRIKELDQRPFKVALLANSKKTINALEIERSLLEKYEDKNIDGEWFSLSENEAAGIAMFLRSIEEELA